MTELQIFENPEFGRMRGLEIDGEPWFVGKDVALMLGYKNPQEAVRNHVDEEDKGVSEFLTPGGTQNLPIINESGLYSLILSSKLPGAKRFKRWVTSEVLPAIRKHGEYIQPGAEPRLTKALIAAMEETIAAQKETISTQKLAMSLLKKDTEDQKRSAAWQKEETSRNSDNIDNIYTILARLIKTEGVRQAGGITIPKEPFREQLEEAKINYQKALKKLRDDGSIRPQNNKNTYNCRINGEQKRRIFVTEEGVENCEHDGL